MQAFFNALFANYPNDPALRIEVRCLAPKWRGEGYRAESRFYPLTPSAMFGASHFSVSMRNTWDVYVGVLPRIGAKKSNDSVFGAGCLYADVDGGEEGYQGSIAIVKRSGLPSPNVAVISGGGLHCYWLLEAPYRFETEEHRQKFGNTLRRLQKAIGGASPLAHADEACKDAARILRVPETFNLKREGEPRRVRLVRNSGERLSYARWLNLLPVIPAPAEKERARYYEKPPDSLPPKVLAWIAEPLAEGSRNKEMTRIAAFLGKDLHLPLSTVVNLLHCKPCHPAIPQRELESIAKWAMKG